MSFRDGVTHCLCFCSITRVYACLHVRDWISVRQKYVLSRVEIVLRLSIVRALTHVVPAV